MNRIDRPNTDETLNELLVRLFKNIVEIEEKYLITPEFKAISVNDMHIIEAVGICEPKSMSAIAKLMSVTMGTLTKSMDGLSEKGYVLADRKMRLNDLAAQVGISNVNLSYLKTGKVKAVRFSTLDAICKVLKCQPGDILEYVENEE